MKNELIRQLNWVDIVIIIIIIRTVFMGFKKGLMVETFKLLGTLFAIFISLHYYSSISNFISSRMPLPVEFLDLIAIISLIIIVLIVFKFMRDGLLILFKTEPLAALDRWGSLILGFIRGCFLSSLVILLIFLSSIEYSQNSVRGSLSSKYFLELSPKTYAFIFDNIFSKLPSEEKINSAIFEKLE